MMKYTNTRYNQMITNVRNGLSTNSVSDADVDTESITRVLEELGIRGADDPEVKLILWNDHVNDMISVVVALYEGG